MDFPIFLTEAAIDSSSANLLTIFLLITFLVFFILFLVFTLGLYIYFSLVYSKIAKRARYSRSGLAWIPFVGPLIIANRVAKKSALPFILGVFYILFMILGMMLVVNGFGISTILGFFFMVAGFCCYVSFIAFVIYWHWKMFEVARKPGWWSIFLLFWPVEAVLLGITAWGK